MSNFSRSHAGLVQEYNPRAGEARVILGGVACRVCGGRGCALKDRVLRVAVPPELQALALEPGTAVRIAGDSRSMVRAGVRLLAAPGAAAAIALYLGSPVLAAVGALLVLLVVLLRGSRRADLPRLIEVSPPDQSGGTSR